MHATSNGNNLWKCSFWNEQNAKLFDLKSKNKNDTYFICDEIRFLFNWDSIDFQTNLEMQTKNEAQPSDGRLCVSFTI